MFRLRPILLALLLAAPLACKPPFDPKLYPSTDKLYQVALAEYNARRYDNAAKAFEQLTLSLPARDPSRRPRGVRPRASARPRPSRGAGAAPAGP